MTFPLIFLTAIRIISLAVLACLLQACSATKLAYNQAPDLAYWYLDGYVDFSSQQSLQVKDDLAKLQSWHRQTQLPTYLETLQKMQQKIPLDVTAVEACSLLADVRRKLVTLSDQAQPAVVSLIDTLSPSQLDTMARKFDKGNAEFRSDYLPTAQPAKPANESKRYKQAVSRAEMLYGKLDDKQLGLITVQVEKSRFNANLAYAERQRRQQDTLQTMRHLLKGQATAEQKRLAVRGLFERTLAGSHPVYVEYAEALTQENCKNFADLHNSTTASQRRKAAATLMAYAQDIKILVAQNNG